MKKKCRNSSYLVVLLLDHSLGNHGGAEMSSDLFR